MAGENQLMQLMGSNGGGMPQGGRGGTLLPQQSAATAAATANALAMHQRAMIAGRDLVVVEQALVSDFRDKALSDNSLFTLEFGRKKVAGLNVRAAEQVVYRMGHIVNETSLTPIGRDVMVTVNTIDLVTNNATSAQAVVSGTVERHAQSDDRVLVGTRQNAKGETLYLYEATPQELLRECLSMQSKLQRSGVFRMLPPRMKVVIMETVQAARAGEFKSSKAKATADLLARFSKMKPSVSAKQVGDYLGHQIDQMDREEYQSLMDIAASIENDAVTWAEVMEDVMAKRGKAPDLCLDGDAEDGGKKGASK